MIDRNVAIGTVGLPLCRCLLACRTRSRISESEEVREVCVVLGLPASRLEDEPELVVHQLEQDVLRCGARGGRVSVSTGLIAKL